MAILIVAIPLAVRLVQTQQQFKSRAAGDEIKFVESETLTCDDQGACTTSSTTIAMELTSPLGPPGSVTPPPPPPGPPPPPPPPEPPPPPPPPPPPAGDSASVTGSQTAITGQAVTYTATLSGAYITGEIHIAKGDGLSPVPGCSTPPQDQDNSKGEYWCRIARGSAPSFSGNFTFTEAGTYRVAVNGYKFDINTTDYDATKTCSGNPFGRYDSDPNKGWVSCGPEDDLTVTVTGSSITVPTASLSVSSTSVTPGQTVNVAATLGGTAQYGELFVTKGDGKTEWNCPAGTTRASGWPNSKGEYWCKLN